MAADFETEIAIVGGGMVGLTLALALDQAGLGVCVVDAAAPESQTRPAYDGRASAIAFAAFRMWRALGVARRLDDDFQRIEDILVTDGAAPDGLRRGGPSALRLHFDRRELDSEPDGEALGYMVENRVSRVALQAALAAQPRIALFAPARVAEIRLESAGAHLALADGRTIEAALIVGADGRSSAVRAAMGAPTIGWAYRQTAIVCTIQHERDHGGVAHEYFLPAGPFALLPLTNNRMNIVWTERRAAAEALLKLSEADFHAELARRVGDFLGAFRLTGSRFSYPLGLQIAERYIGARAVLVGDAAHAIHPIAGQGLNMGLRDVAALTECIADSARIGLDPSDFTGLERYQRWRRFDNTALGLATDGFNRLFSNDAAPLRLARDVGMAAVGGVGAVRRFFMREAGGGNGALPKLLRRERVAAY
ncbi:MAG: UbiH/UbiF/VisC/COQ6 family ubiquinone biosynthesis hydroxylase [Hyphomonadaceae bacterium]